MIYIATLLTGTWPENSNLGESYVHALYGMAQHYAPRGIPWRFVCFTDREFIQRVPTRPVPDTKLGWFNKAYLFSHRAFPRGSRVLFLDLDTAIVGDWTPFVDYPEGQLVALRNTWGKQEGNEAFGSGIMGWDAGARYFPWWSRLQMGGVPRGMRTDEQWFKSMLEADFPGACGWRAWQDVAPGRALSYKAHIMGFDAGLEKKYVLTPEAAQAARIIYFHGEPRPHTVNQKWNSVYHHVHGS